MIESFYLLILLILAIRLYAKDKSSFTDAVRFTKKISFNLIPYVIAILLIASILNVYISKDFISNVIGEKSGIIALLLAAIFGSIFEGPTVVAFILGVSLLDNGASKAVVGTFIAAFSMVGLVAFSMEKKELGTIFTATRFVVTLISTVGIGYVMGVLLQ